MTAPRRAVASAVVVAVIAAAGAFVLRWWGARGDVVLSVVLFLLGVGAADPRLQGFGVLMLLSAPLARPWIAEFKRRWY